MIKNLLVIGSLLLTGCATKLVTAPDNATIDPRVMAECETKVVLKSPSEEDVLQYIKDTRQLLKVCADTNRAKKLIIEKAFSK